MKETKIQKDTSLATEITFYHVEEENLEKVASILQKSLSKLSDYKGFVSVNILTSTDQSRVLTYIQWEDEKGFQLAFNDINSFKTDAFKGMIENDISTSRLYEVHYADDRSEGGYSVISPDYKGVMFINEITTIPGPKQYRLLELVVANNIKDSFATPGYRSANFHRSLDGFRAVNYSLWDTEEHLIEAISAMAGEDINLEETVAIASPDFRFYTLTYSNHI